MEKCQVKKCNKEVDGTIEIGDNILKACSPEHMEIILLDFKLKQKKE